jgi:AraC family transcriptional regulator
MIARQFAEQSILNRLTNTKNGKDEKQIIWPNILMNCSETSFQKKLDETSLTLITNRQGQALCEVDGQSYKICSSAFLIINPFQRLEYTIDNSEETETANIHFNLGFVQSLYQYFTESDAYLLDNIEESRNNKLPLFFNELHYKNSIISKLIEQLLLSPNKYQFDEKLSAIGMQLFLNHQESQQKIKSLKSRKPSTKKELYKRISKAKDIIFYSYEQPLSIEEISQNVCVSKYHFTRIFKDIYGISPYQFLKVVRLEKAKELLAKDYSIQEVADKIGFEEGNSFINAFKAYTNTSPTEFQNIISKNE